MLQNAGHKRWIFSALSLSMLLFFTCKLELGESPMGPPINDRNPVINPNDTTRTITGTRQFHLYPSKTQLKADNSDTATITAVLIDQYNNPAVGDTILFSCNIGVIETHAVVDASGRANVILRAMPVNGVCVVKGTALRTRDTASTMVVFAGIKLNLESEMTDQKIGEYITITAVLKDGSGNAIGGGDSAAFTAKNGLFSNSAASYRALIDPTGHATARVTSRSAGTTTVFATALNSSDSLSLIFTNNALALSASKTTLTVGGTDQATLTATYVNGSNQPVPNIPVTFSTNAGTITTATVNTNSAGVATTTIRSATFAGVATVVATTSAGNAVIKITFVAAHAAKVKLAISPDNIGVNGGIASLTATVTDVNSNMVTGSDVNFRVLRSPGGGEYIDKPVVTSQNGIARAQFFAGSIPSLYRDCLIAASVGGIADTQKLTISGEPYAITVARPQSDTVVVERAGQMSDATFDYFTGAVVVDINGNPVADGTQVNFSVIVTGMAVYQRYLKKWIGEGKNTEALIGYYLTDVVFEDINNNYKMDEIDLKLDHDDKTASRGDDFNGDGRCDFDPNVHDLWVDFDGDSVVEVGMTTIPLVDSTPITKDTFGYRWERDTTPTGRKDTMYLRPYPKVDTIGWDYDTMWWDSYEGAEPSIIVQDSVSWYRVYADLYPNGHWDTKELVRDYPPYGEYNAPSSGDRRWWELETYPAAGWRGTRFEFDKNDFAISINSSATCKNGVADVHVTYPRQLARRIYVTVNAEAKGVRDRDGERFLLPVIVGK
jgi:hypothetical protein